MRSLATRRQNLATSAVLKDAIGLLQLASFDLIIVETAGIGQSDSEIADVVDHSLYVMTSEYGARQPAREDRHARLRRHDRAQQVREARRRGCAARRSQAVASQSSGPGEVVGRARSPCSRPSRAASTILASIVCLRELCKALDETAKESGASQTVMEACATSAQRSSSRAIRSFRVRARAISRRSPRMAAGRSGTHRPQSTPHARRSACMSRCARCTMRRCRRRWIAIRTSALNDPQADATRRELARSLQPRA